MPLQAYMLVLVTCLLPGCVAVSRIDYPRDWAPTHKVEAGTCPRIAGIYKDPGTLRGQGTMNGTKYRNPNAWNGDTYLLTNLVKTTDASAVFATEIAQPDSDTLIIQTSSDPTSQQWQLRRSRGDFDCNESGMTMSASGGFFAGSTKYAAADAMVTTIGVLLLSGGVVSHTRSFRPLDDGSLLMEVTQNGFMAHGVVLGWDYRSFVRWERTDAERTDLSEPH